MARIPTFHKKLRETQFFFRHISDQNKPNRLESEEIEFFLSAFLSAGRSVVTFFEKKNEKKRKSWFQKWKSGLAEPDRQFLHYMTKQRDLEVHEEGASHHHSVEMVPLKYLPMGPLQAHIAYGHQDSGVPAGMPLAAIAQKIYYFRIDEKDESVIETCGRYVDLLEKLVRDFDQSTSGD